ncbi:hypothetical protein KL942_000142 [Ogataea angusta]|uniref:C2H2-type domain-containing protein n=1 Tax=Pichia angusta TaxID=870730 RepID=A0AAN6DJW7_PICAN|nr:uncharacterized protein KL928_000937 [Ogataea angusta]KAG7820853.1 hypothetical protein KL928_000937 [Ogataea angusta]KAG7826447.1 hypothetical protein KL909_000499 [Ogataea angusta]KAG7831807.1 hypothetical protein KL920_000142 [Ogataea angusta]KAG7835980.1 hypothetical protein KL943_001629 [Ogataea angusta]KAG7843046.1 hypothetical protein KL942_000142 [Ogataea angusta]
MSSSSDVSKRRRTTNGHKNDHQTLDNQVNEYLNDMNYVDDVQNDVRIHNFGVDLSSLNNEDFHIDPSIANEDTKQQVQENISAAAAAVVAYQETRRANDEKQSDKPSHVNENSSFRLLEVPENVDPKKMCRFCGKTFAHPGSLGRHLDNRKGSPMHPADQIERIRSNVARRGNPEEVRARRAERARLYNRRDYVKLKNRERRRTQSKVYRVRENAQLQFYKSISTPFLAAHPSFPRMVLFFLAPKDWPHDPPTFQTHETLIMHLDSDPELRKRLPYLSANLGIDDYKEKLKTAYENWMTLSNEAKKEMWSREQRLCAQDALGSLSLFDFAIREKWAHKLTNDKKQEIMQSTKSESMGSPNYNDSSDSDSSRDVKNVLCPDEFAAVAAAAAAVVNNHDE